MKKLLILTLFCFSCGRSKADALSDMPLDASANVNDLSAHEDMSDTQSPDLFDDFEEHKKHCLQYEKKTTCENDSRCLPIFGARCGTELVTCLPSPLVCGQLAYSARSPDGVCYVYGSTCMPDGFVEADIAYDECMNEGCE